MRYPIDTIVDTTEHRFSYVGCVDDVHSYGRTICIQDQYPIYKYKMIERVNGDILERIIATLFPLELSKLILQPGSTGIHQLSVKTYRKLPKPNVTFYRFVQDAASIIEYLNTDRPHHYTSTLSKYFWYLMYLASHLNQPHILQELRQFYQNNRLLLDGVARQDHDHHNNDKLHQLIDLTNRRLDYGTDNRDMWLDHHYDSLIQNVEHAMPKQLDLISKWALTVPEYSPTTFRSQTDSSYGGRLYLWQTNYSVQPFTIDANTKFNADFNDVHVALDVFNYLETLPYTDIYCECSKQDGELKYIWFVNSKHELILNQQPNEDEQKQLIYLLSAWLRHIVCEPEFESMRINKTWLEEIYVTIRIGDHCHCYYFDLTIWGLGSHTIIENDQGFHPEVFGSF